MKIAAIVAGVLILLIAGVVVIGFLLPKRHVASRRASFHAAPDRLFALVAGSQEWRPDVKSCETIVEPDGRQFQRETSKQGETILYELEGIEAPRRISRRIATENLPYGGSWSFTIEPSGAGDVTMVRITEEGEVYNPIFRFVSKFVLGQTHTIDAYLRAMASTVGEQIQIED
jgi:hypothetical protein